MLAPEESAPIEALEAVVTNEDTVRMGIEWNSHRSQGPLEGWAVLLALRTWYTHLVGKTIVIRSDSMVALAMAKKLSSGSPVLNWIGAELAIRMERARIGRLVTQHIPGKWNFEADWLSRPHERGEMPRRLQNLGIKKLNPSQKAKTYLPLLEKPLRCGVQSLRASHRRSHACDSDFRLSSEKRSDRFTTAGNRQVVIQLT